MQPWVAPAVFSWQPRIEGIFCHSEQCRLCTWLYSILQLGVSFLFIKRCVWDHQYISIDKWEGKSLKYFRRKKNKFWHWTTHFGNEMCKLNVCMLSSLNILFCSRWLSGIFFLLKVSTIEIKSHASEKEVATVVLRRDCPFWAPSGFHSPSALQGDQDDHSYRSPRSLHATCP